MASASKKISAWGFGNGGGQIVEWRRVTDQTSDADAKKKLEEEYRNWGDDLPWPALSLIMTKIGGIDLLMNAQFVCRSWWQVSLDPTIWRITDLRRREHHRYVSDLDIESMAVVAVNRSNGLMEKYFAEYFGNDHLLIHIADRSTKLKCLCLECSIVSVYELAEAISRFPNLEELDLTHSSFTDHVCKRVGQACPRLKCFRLNSLNSRYQFLCNFGYYKDKFSGQSDEQALAIANTMPHLIRLQLIGNRITEEGLKAILDKCVHLESLEIRHCFGVNFDSGLKEKCGKIKDLRLSNDYTEDSGLVFEDLSLSNNVDRLGDLGIDYCFYDEDIDDELGSPSSDLLFEDELGTSSTDLLFDEVNTEFKLMK